VQAGPCGSATLAGLREIVKMRNLFELDEESVVLIICSEGSRSYDLNHLL